MAALWFNTVDITFDPVGAPLSRWKAVMAARMQSGNFTDVVTNDAEVAGGRSDGWTSVAPLHKRDLGDGRQEFVIVIMCAADSLDVAKSNVSDVRLMMGWDDGLWQPTYPLLAEGAGPETHLGMGEWRGYSAPDDGENRPECVDLISDVLPFGRLWYGEPHAVSNAIGFAKFYSCSHPTVIRVHDAAGNVIETHEHRGDFREP